MKLVISTPLVTSLPGMCRCWISTPGMMPIRDCDPNQKPAIMMKICTRLLRCGPETTSMSGARLFSLSSHTGDSGTLT